MESERVRVLLIEDNRDDVYLLQEALSEATTVSFELTHVERVGDALQLLARERFDVILVDLSLPDSQGLDSLLGLQRTTSNIPIVVLTGLDDEATAVMAVRAGAQDYLVKGRAEPDLLTRAIQHAIDRKRGEERIRKLNEELEQRVEERTAQLVAINEQLASENAQRRRAEADLQRANRALRTVSDCNHALIHATEEADFFQRICEIVVQSGGYAMAWVGLARDDAEKSVEPVAQAGLVAGYLNTVKVSWADTVWGGGPTGTVIRTARICVCNDVRTDPRCAPWREEMARRGYAASIGLPLKVEGRVVGALNIYAAEKDAFSVQEEVDLLEELANDLSFGVMALRTRIRRDQVQAELEEQRILFRALLDSSPDFIIFKDRDGRFQVANESTLRFFGVGMDQLIGRMDLDLMPEEEATRYGQEDQAVLTRGHSLVVEHLLRSPHGDRWNEAIKMPLKDGAGNITGLLSLERDITERKHATERLVQAETRYRTLVEQVPAVTYITGPDSFAALYVSPQIQSLLGFSPAEWEAEPGLWVRQLHRDDREWVLAKSRDSRASRASLSMEYRMLTRGGRTVWLRDEATLVQEGSGGSLIYHGMLFDITQQKQVEETLRQLNRALRMLSQCNQAVVRAADETSLLQQICRYIVEIGEYPCSWIGLGSGDEGATMRPAAYAAGGDVRLAEVLWRMPDMAVPTEVRVCRDPSAEPGCGPQREEMVGLGFTSAIALPLIADGHALGAMHMLTTGSDAFSAEEVSLLRELADNTAYAIASLRTRAEHELANAALRESEERYRRLLDSIPVGVGTANLQGRILSANRAAQEITGYTMDELKELHIRTLCADPDDFLRVMDVLNTTDRIHNQTVRLVRKDGTPWWALINIDTVDVDGAASLLTTLRDISELKAAEADKETIQAQLLQSQKMEAVGRLAGGVAHDFNNLLTTIQGYTSLAIMLVPDDDPLHRDLEAIQKAAVRAAGLTRQLLLFSRKQPMEFAPVSINRIIDGLLKMLSRLIGEDVAILTDLQDEVWTIEADAGQIEQVIMNLAVNARDAMPGGGTLSIRTENRILEPDSIETMPQARPGRFVRLDIEDTGIGMDNELTQHIFEPFFTTKSEGKGTGLGLSVVYGIVSEHKGWINVYSEPGHGSRFSIYLPAHFARIVDDTEQELPLDAFQGHGERVLLVEDQDDVRGLAVRVLREGGYTVFEAANATLALDLFEQEKGEFELVFSDVVLPDTDGLQLLDEINRRRPGLRFLLASGYADEKSRWPIIRDRGYRFINKPYRLVDLLRVVREVIA